jgi:hypothetical protein
MVNSLLAEIPVHSFSPYTDGNDIRGIVGMGPVASTFTFMFCDMHASLLHILLELNQEAVATTGHPVTSLIALP